MLRLDTGALARTMEEPMTIDRAVSKAAKATMRVVKRAVKAKGMGTEDLAEKLGVERSEVRKWFDGSMPYEAFLQICKLTGTSATKVFSETKTVMREAKRNTNHASTVEKESVKKTKKDSSAVNADSKEPEPEEEEREDGLTTTGLPAEKSVDMNAPDSPPFDLMTSKEAGLKGADALVMDWATIKQRTMQKLKDTMTDDQYRRRMETFPKAVKVSDKEVNLVFKSYAQSQGFINSGVLNALDDIVGKAGYGVTIGVSSKKDGKQ